MPRSAVNSAMRGFTFAAVTSFLLPFAPQMHSQWEIQDAHTTASLRGIHYVGNGVAWASGADGTVLRTEDMGFVWQLCTVPPGAEKLDFRGVQAFDNNTAIVMSSGKGDLSRLYKTTDGCQTWKLVAKNPDKDGFWDAIRMSDSHNGWLFGDPVNGRFVVEETHENGDRWPGLDKAHTEEIATNVTLPRESDGRGGFAASNSAFATPPLSAKPTDDCRFSFAWFGTSGPKGARIYRLESKQPQCSDWGLSSWIASEAPLAGANAASGVFSIAARDYNSVVAVGGNYQQADSASGNAAFTLDGGRKWFPAETDPRGYRSAVAYDSKSKAWITVGPNGTDLSIDGGRNWHPLKPAPGDAPDADQHWNALSLPFVVGPKGRIGLLDERRLTK